MKKMTAAHDNYLIEARNHHVIVSESQGDQWIEIDSIQVAESGQLLDAYGFNRYSPAVRSVIEEAAAQ